MTDNALFLPSGISLPRHVVLFMLLFCTSCAAIVHSPCSSILKVSGDNNIVINECNYIVNRLTDEFYPGVYPVVQRLALMIDMLMQRSNTVLAADSRYLSDYRRRLLATIRDIKANYYQGAPTSMVEARQIMDIINEGLSLLDSFEVERDLPKLNFDLKKIISNEVLEIGSYRNPNRKQFEELMKLGVLDISNACIGDRSMKLNDLEGIGLFVGARELRADCHNISDIIDLQFAPGLTDLSLNFNKINSLRGIEILLGLRSLSIKGNELTSLEGIEDLLHLEEINVSGNPLQSIEPLLELVRKSDRLNQITIDCNNLNSNEYRQLLQSSCEINCL